MSRRMWVMTAALVLAGFTVAAVVATSGESCDAWHERYQHATEQIVGTTGAAKDNAVRAWLDVSDARPKGCEL